MKIYKYRIDESRNSSIQLPEGAQILSAGVQDARIFIWAIVDESRDLEERKFCVFGTGWELPEDINNRKKWVFIDRVAWDLAWDLLVFHVFELIE